MKLLERLAETAVDAAEFFITFSAAFLTAGYGASPGKLEFEQQKFRRALQKYQAHAGAEERLRQRFYEMVHVLQRDGLVEKRSTGSISKFFLTAEGRRRLARLREQSRRSLPDATRYVSESGDHLMIVMFDIPETERRKRAWLRAVLKRLELRMVQKSVWIGKRQLPQMFLDDLRRLRLQSYVEIFSVSKTGTLRPVV